MSRPDWLNATLALGVASDEQWAPLGAGVLFLDDPIVWLITTRSLVEQAGDAPIAAWVGQDDTQVVDLTATQQQIGLEWVTHPELDLAATVFPIGTHWTLKAFTLEQCADELQPSMLALTVCHPYGAETLGLSNPEPFVLDGVISRVDAAGGSVQSTAPVLPRNVGAPLLVRSGDMAYLAGICTQPVLVPATPLPPIALTNAVHVSAAVDMVRGDLAAAQRDRAIKISDRIQPQV